MIIQENNYRRIFYILTLSARHFSPKFRKTVVKAPFPDFGLWKSMEPLGNANGIGVLGAIVFQKRPKNRHYNRGLAECTDCAPMIGVLSAPFIGAPSV